MNVVLKQLIDSMSTKEIVTELVDRSDVMRSTSKLMFNEIEDDVVYPKDASDQDSFDMTLPVIDESSLEEYAMSDIVLNSKRKILPPAGFFTKLVPGVVKHPLGMLEIKFDCFEMHLNQSDNRYLKDKFIYSESAYFVFNYDDNVYLRLDAAELEKALYKLKSNELELDNIKSDRVKEYVLRTQKLDELKSRLKALYINQTKRLFQLEKKKFSATSKDSIVEYLLFWKSYFETHFNQWNDLNYVFSLVSESEYFTYQKTKDDALKRIDISLECAENIDEPFDNISKDFTEEVVYKRHQFIIETISFLTDLVRERSGSKASNFGYIVVENREGKNIVTESLVEIAKRNMIIEDKVTTEELRAEKESIAKRKGL